MAEPTRAGHLCRVMRQAGIADTNPGHPDLITLAGAGCSDAEAQGAARTAVERGKGFAYAVGTLKRQRIEAAQTAQQVHKGPMPTPPPSAGAMLLGLHHRPETSEPDTIDMED